MHKPYLLLSKEQLQHFEGHLSIDLSKEEFRKYPSGISSMNLVPS